MNAPIAVLPTIRRLQLPDLDTHASWFLPRFLQAYPHLNDRAAVGFLKGILHSNDSLFLFQPHAIGLAQFITSDTLSAKAVIYERFVWVEDPTDKVQIESASFFYSEFERWAKSLRIDTIVVEEMTDVPHELIKQRLGRIFNRQQQFARV